MALETAFFLAGELLKLNPILLLGVVIVSAYAAFRIFAYILRMLTTGLVFGAFPLIANVVGIPIPLTLQSILWSVFLGMVIYLCYGGLTFVWKIMGAFSSPVRRGFGRSQAKTVVVKKVIKEKESN